MTQRFSTDRGALACSAVLLLGSITMLGMSSGPPFVRISDVNGVEEGTEIMVIGVLVDLRTYDSGAESLTIADLDDGDRLRAICLPGMRAQPSAYARIGDELQIMGEVGASDSGPVLFTSSDEIEVLRESELVLTLESVCRNWYLFEGDIFRVVGILRSCSPDGDMRLYDRAGWSSMSVVSGEVDLEEYDGLAVTITALLRFDTRLGALVLEPSYVVPLQ